MDHFRKAKTLITTYGALSVMVLLTLGVLSALGHPATSFMWGRSGGVFASALVSYLLIGRAAKGARSAYTRIRIISVIMPVAIIGVDLIPGVCPTWFLLLQGTCALPIAVTAFVINGSRVRRSFQDQQPARV